MAVLALALVSAAVIAAYAATSAEAVTNNARRAQYRAHQLATAGLQQFLVRRGEPGFCSNCVADAALADSEWTRVSLDGGYADVVATRVRPRLSDAAPALFFVRSRGVDTAVRLGGAGGGTFASRTVGQYATFGTARIRPMAALTSLNGVIHIPWGARPLLNGYDECSYATRASAVVPSGSVFRTWYYNPYPSVDSSMSMDSIRQRIGIDWNAIINHNALPADVTIPPDGNWPSFYSSSYWPVIRIRKSWTLPSSGRGIIIADSNLTMSTGDDWDGIILIGGRLTMTGYGDVEGVVVTGLNRLLPGGGAGIAAPDSIRAYKQIQYSSCDAANAADRLRMYFAWPNTWVDNVADW